MRKVGSVIIVLFFIAGMGLVLAAIPSAASTTTYTITFTANNLPSTDKWAITYDDQDHFQAPVTIDVAAGTTSVTHQIGNGTWVANAVDVSNPNVAGNSTAFTVNGANMTVNFYFGNAGASILKVYETGLPNGTTWSGSVNLGGVYFWSWDNNFTSYTFQLQPGLYQYQFWNTNASGTTYVPVSNSGYFTMAPNSTYTLVASYGGVASGSYAVTINEENLTGSPQWNVIVNGATYSTVDNLMTIYLSAGSYTLKGWSGSTWITNTTLLTVSGNESINLTFYKVSYGNNLFGSLGAWLSNYGLTVAEFFAVLIYSIGLVVGLLVFARTHVMFLLSVPMLIGCIFALLIGAITLGYLILPGLLAVATFLLDKRGGTAANVS